MGQQLENLPAPQVVGKAMRMTRTKRAALDALANLGSNYVEWGTPPYAVSLLAAEMDVDLSNLTKTMRTLERAGFVVLEIARVECWNAISNDHTTRRCVCYWLAETMEQDKARADAWNAGADERSDKAWQAMRF